MEIEELKSKISEATKAISDNASGALKKANEAFAATDELLKKYETSENEQKELQSN